MTEGKIVHPAHVTAGGVRVQTSETRQVNPYSQEKVIGWFQFHPGNPVTGPMHDDIREQFRVVAAYLLDNLPDGPDKTLALRKLQEAMWASNSCVANAGLGESDD